MLRFTVKYIIATALLLGNCAVALAQDLPVGELMMFEQQYINRTLDTNRIVALNNYQAREYSPEEGLTFVIHSYWVPVDSAYVFEAPGHSDSLGFNLRRKRNGKEQVLFLVHPESQEIYGEFLKYAQDGPVFLATATSSSRTLLAWPRSDPDKVFFAKLSLAKEIGGVVRTIPLGEISRSVGTTMILDAARDELPSEFKYMPEFYGVMPKGMARGGMLLRLIPDEVKNGNSRLMPLFALYTNGPTMGLSPIQQMIATSRIDAKDFVIERIFKPFIKQWIELAINDGITMEAHAQNFLMEINGRGLPTGKFVFRDFGGFNVDLEYRRRNGLPMPETLPAIENEFEEYHQRHHRKALRSSLQSYFEGGVLFGLGNHLKSIGERRLSYDNLINILHRLVAQEMHDRGYTLRNRHFYDDLIRSLLTERGKISKRNACVTNILNKSVPESR